MIYNSRDAARPAADKDPSPTPLRDETTAPRRPDSHSHPFGVGVGAAGGTLAGAAAGAVLGGPLGAAVGAVVGAVAGGATGHGIAAQVNPSEEEAYWRANYASRPYHDGRRSFTDYAPAYATGYLGFAEYGGTPDFAEAETKMKQRYLSHNAGSMLTWEEARPVAQDAWDRLHERVKARNEDDRTAGRVSTSL